MKDIYVITVARNEEKILPFFLDHYSTFADKIIVADNNSSDHTAKIARTYEKVEYQNIGNVQFDDLTKNGLQNEVIAAHRKPGRWMIVVDTDEFIHLPVGDIREWFETIDPMQVFLKPQGFQMVASSFPEYTGKPIFEMVKEGFHDPGFSKPCIFDSEFEIMQAPGFHSAMMNYHGNMIHPTQCDLFLLHYKFLGLKHRLERIRNTKINLSEVGTVLAQKEIIGTQILSNEKRLTDEFNTFWDKRTKVL